MHNLLENKIREHAGEIFGSEPLTGHRERFAGKLDATGGKKQILIRRITGWLSAAAVLAGAIFFAKNIFQPEMDTESLSEVQSYYAMLLQDKIDDIEPLLQTIEEEDRNDLLTDMESMQKEAEAYIHNSSEKNIPFIVKVYTTQIEALDHIQNILTH